MKVEMKESNPTPVSHTLSIALVVLFLVSMVVVTTRTGMLPFLWVIG